MRSIGVDIGHFSIKIAEVESSSKGVIVHRLEEYPIHQDPNRDKNLETIEILRAVPSSKEAQRIRWSAAIPLEEVLILPSSFPFSQRQKILKSAPYELEDAIPLEISETIFDIRTRKIGKEQTDVITVAAPREAIKSHLSHLKDAMIDPHVLTVDGIALANLFEAWNLPPLTEAAQSKPLVTETILNQIPEAPAQIVLSLGHQNSLALLTQNNQLLDARSIGWGGHDVIEALARSYSVPYVEAARMLQTKGFILTVAAGASREQQTLSNAITGAVSSLANEMRLMVIEWKSKFNLPVSEVLLTGGLSQIPNLAPYLTQAMELPTNIFHYLDTGFQLRTQKTDSTEAVMGMALALAVEGLRRPKNPAINFRKEEFARQNLQGQKLWEIWGPTVRLAGIAYLILFVYGWIREDLATRQAEQAREKLQAVIKDRNFLNDTKTMSNWYNKAMQKKKEESRRIQSLGLLRTTDGYTSALEVVRKVSNVLPQGRIEKNQKIEINLYRLNVQNESVIIEGRVNNSQHLSIIQDSLVGISSNGKVNTAKPSGIVSGPGTPFAFEFQVGRFN